MILESVRVKNFLSIKDATLHCDRLTVLVGANGSGKSAFIKAIGMFNDSKARATAKDYHKNNIDDEMSVSITFGSLSDEAAKEFFGYVTGRKLTVKCDFVWDEGEEEGYPAFRSDLHTNPDFVAVRTASTAAQAKAEYKKLQTSAKYDLPDLNAKNEITECLDAWDREHPDQRTGVVADDGVFEAKWKRRESFVRFVEVPAIHDAAKDVDDAKNSLLNLLTASMKKIMVDEEEYQAWMERARNERARVVRNVGQELKEIKAEITENFGQFVNGAKVGLSWNDELSEINMPKIDVTLDEDGHGATVDRAGHGSQRAFIMAMLQTIGQPEGSVLQARAGTPTLILTIEEPELYQHPIRQRHISSVLDSLAGFPDRGMQIIYTTHSPHFVGIDKLDHVRLLQKTAEKAQGTKTTKAHKTSIDQLLKNLEKIGVNKSRNFIKERLQIIMTPWLNEGFFAETVVLVEGAIDYAAIMSMSRLLDRKFEARGVSVIPCGGIENMLEPYVIFKELKIPTYVVSDLDSKGPGRGGDPDKRHAIQRLLCAQPSTTQINDDFACFETNLEGAIKADIGEDSYNRLVDEQKERFGMGPERKKALGKPRIMYEVLKQAKEEGKPCRTLERIVKKISAKAPKPV